MKFKKKLYICACHMSDRTINVFNFLTVGHNCSMF